MDTRPHAFLEEDGAGWRDVTSALVEGHDADAVVRTRDSGIAAGVAEARSLFEHVGLTVETVVDDGDAIAAGDDVLRVSGDARALLEAERLALNFLGSMSGIASATRTCVDRAGETRVAATRKTTPGFRYFEKKAVRVGGGDPHRYDLADAVLIKENHIDIVGLETAVREACERASFTTKVEVEAETEPQARRAAAYGADIVLLDNMTPAEVADCVETLPDDVLTEASGGITPETVADYAAAGVDVVSMGSLTHSANWLDVTLLTE
ncbi:carboxylating nicotinate-nucleotide diphosphorylase [Halarchaeum nitratireducens]|uniref:Nicotinate-nucleotide pyrophosphorylase [carboxylating] n=1 Tax=Halarchaeum nitratireducens TaxID=489913 RepID=A0A830G992_9EURY|nr:MULTISPECIES: carboxylating nicotinate-nucleotide diphosphorylase [Halarchaeum]MBP2249939.1 nicotinate-nucleotide pyrophosphorylase (carboxylating) [Halarchaeum solikamskense]GGN09651.1 nicotinate-nucleotide diphosphorylase (carboxylating) [Halarchaeum nitratireducens]